MKYRASPYKTKCRRCGREIAKGEMVMFGKHEGAQHAHCSEQAPAPAPQPARQPFPPDTESFVAPAVRGRDGVYRYHWESISALVADAARNAAQSPAWLTELDGWLGKAGTRFMNGMTLAKLAVAVSQPDASLLQAVDELRAEIADSVQLPKAARRHVVHARECGQELDPDAVRERRPNAWDGTARQPTPSRCVTIGINLSANCHLRQEHLLYRGAAACALADVLSERGVNVRIVAFDATRDPSEAVKLGVVSVELKAADMPMDLAAVATAACDIGFFRLGVVTAQCRRWPGDKPDDGLGYATALPAADRAGIDYLVEQHVTTREAAVEWLRAATQSTQGEN